MFATFKLSLDVYIFACLDSATVLATFSKKWVIFFIEELIGFLPHMGKVYINNLFKDYANENLQTTLYI
jgi:hypothetical protein